ncbi:hypothetical protein IDH28_02895 [Pelagibacterales bacterium SAG-MED31]|nr:hypothetical protein [Pelagibacterales bacterium SAG-MED31]
MSCSNINFLLDTKEDLNFLKNKTVIYVDGSDNRALRDGLFLQIGEVVEKKFILTTKVTEKQTKRSVSENQVAQKIDYKIIIDYTLSDINKKCPDLKNIQISNFSFTPKSSGYNFASDILLQNLYEEAVLKNINSFMSFVSNKFRNHTCLNEN